jgi:hypothetical protein
MLASLMLYQCHGPRSGAATTLHHAGNPSSSRTGSDCGVLGSRVGRGSGIVAASCVNRWAESSPSVLLLRLSRAGFPGRQRSCRFRAGLIQAT